MSTFFATLHAWPFAAALVVAVLAVVTVWAFRNAPLLPDDGDRRGN
jgi:ABC-type spermidine/putrescine transport system permease subunit I